MAFKRLARPSFTATPTRASRAVSAEAHPSRPSAGRGVHWGSLADVRIEPDARGPGSFRAPMAVSDPHDVLEREAERVADEVMRTSVPPRIRAPLPLAGSRSARELPARRSP